MNYSTRHIVVLTLSASAVARRIVRLTTLQTFGLLCFTFAAVVMYMLSNQLRGGGWKDLVRLFIVPYRQRIVGPEMEVHCVVSPCLRHE